MSVENSFDVLLSFGQRDVELDLRREVVSKYPGTVSPGLNEIFCLKQETSVFMFDPIFKILRIKLGLCLVYAQIRHLPKALLVQEKIQIFNSGRHKSQKTDECQKMS